MTLLVKREGLTKYQDARRDLLVSVLIEAKGFDHATKNFMTLMLWWLFQRCGYHSVSNSVSCCCKKIH